MTGYARGDAANNVIVSNLRRSELRLYNGLYKFCAYSGIFSPDRSRT